MHPEYLWFELKEANLRRVHFAHVVDAVSVHVFEDSFSQLDKESVIFPSLGEDLDEIYIRCPSWQLIDWWQDIVVQKVRIDCQEVLVEASTIVS